MTLTAIPGFHHFATHHCVTGSMRHIYVFHGHLLSEEMLLGIGGGVGFSYWHFQGQPPFLGGRGGIKPPMEEVTGERTGVVVQRHTTGSARKAQEALLELLEAGQPVMIGCDMGFLPYFDFGGQEYHFGGHAVVVCAYDRESDQVLVADRDEALHPVPLEALAKARGSTFKPFPPKNLWYTFDFRHKRPPTVDEVRQAIQEQARLMLEPPIRNIGVAGIRKAAEAVPRWPESLPPGELRAALFNAYIFISPVGGSGGGLFRYMFSRFVGEAAEICGDRQLVGSADEFKHIGDRWEALGGWFRRTSEAAEPAAHMQEGGAALHELAKTELAAWQRLRSVQ